MHHLLHAQITRAHAPTIAADLSMTPASVNEVLRFLRFHSGIGPRPGNEVRWRRVAETFSHLRLAAMMPARQLHGPVDAHGAAELLDAAGVPHVFAFRTAANLWAYFEPEPQTHIIVSPTHLKAAKEALEGETTNRSRAPNTNLFADDIRSVPNTLRQDLQVTDRLMTWIDLRHFPFAGAHHAFFESVIMDLYEAARNA